MAVERDILDWTKPVGLCAFVVFSRKLSVMSSLNMSPLDEGISSFWRECPSRSFDDFTARGESLIPFSMCTDEINLLSILTMSFGDLSQLVWTQIGEVCLLFVFCSVWLLLGCLCSDWLPLTLVLCSDWLLLKLVLCSDWLLSRFFSGWPLLVLCSDWLLSVL